MTTARRGLCASCINMRVIQNNRGSMFLLCELSRTDPRYPRYPRLPVVACDGYRPVTPLHTEERGGEHD